MQTFLTMALAPFALLVMLLIAWPVKRAIQRRLPDGRLKRFLLFRWD